MTKKSKLFYAAFVLILSFGFAVSADVVMSFYGNHFPSWVFVGIFFVCCSCLVLFKVSLKKAGSLLLISLLSLIVALALICVAFRIHGAYSVSDNGKDNLFAQHKVLVLVPHQDDELLVAGGVIEEYLRYGSDVFLAFYTNGDVAIPGETRLNEALSVAKSLAIPEKNVFFLGYGDNLNDDAHIYNSEPDRVVASNKGVTRTYALDKHPPFNDSLYTRENIVSDIESLFLSLKPDIIISTEYEMHADHLALSLFIDEALRNILAQAENNYYPILLKNPCYLTAYLSTEDFYSDNLLSSVIPDNMMSHLRHSWDERIRFPVYGEGLSRSLLACDTYKQLRLHKSQTIPFPEATVNGDKLYWLRETHSVLYNANISTSSGITDYLNDFKLLDNPVVEYDPSHIDNCVWIPDANDKLATATISFDAPQDIEYIYLYDNPAQNSNVLNARISFDDGSTLETGPLNSNGSAAKFCVEKSDVLSFSVQILKTEGDAAGLTEIEAYGYSRDYGFNFVKVTDMDGNFVYDYYTSQDGDCQLLLYSPGTQEDFQISSDNPRCSVTYESGNISVICPKGQSCTIRVDSSDGEFSDTVRVSNPGRFMRETGPRYEKLLRQFPNGNMQKSNSYLLLRAIYRAIR